MKLFGTDGARGEAGKFLNSFFCMKLAMSAGIYFRKHSVTNKILVGKDTRRSGYMIENAIVSGLTAVGYNVVQIGPMPTPAIAFLTEDMRCDGGVMISASHNPYYDNGIKFFNHLGDKLQEKDEREIEEIFFNEEILEENQKTKKEIGSSKRIDDVIGRYIVHIKNSFPKELTLRGVRVVIDAANGAAYKVAPTIFSELGADIIVINDSPNGYNINQKCGAIYPEDLCATVKKYRADIGFALDGDADRLVVVDEKGEVINGDKLLAFLALYLKKEKKLKNDAIVTTFMSNQAMEEYLNKNGISVFRCNIGDKYVVEELKKRDLNFGGENSGHIIVTDFGKTGDGLVSALQTIAYVIKSGKSASEALNLFELYPQILKNIPVGKKLPLNEIEGFEKLKNSLLKDGCRPLIRYSGTENYLRILIEGKNEKFLNKKIKEIEEFFQKRLN